MARPRSSADLHIRIPPRELRAWKAAARRSNETLTEWVRARLNAVVTPAAPLSEPAS